MTLSKRTTGLIWAAVAVVTLLRLAAAILLPMTGDEAYYWEWSRRLAFGYVDHPPAVAWTIAAFAFCGTAPGIVRLGFWLCGIFSTAALADCARRITPEFPRAAAALAALFFSLAPILSLAFGTASPDGPYLAAWTGALDLAIIIWLRSRSSQTPSPATALAYPRLEIALGLMLGLGLLARAFAVALFAGILVVLRRPVARALRIAAIAGLICIPYLLWNAQHDWANIRFTFGGRHVNEGFSLIRPLITLLEIIAAFGLTLLPVTFWAALRVNNPVISATALPLIALFFGLSLVERVEIYWFFGPYASLCVGAAAYFAARPVGSLPWKRIFAPAAGLTTILLITAVWPFGILRIITSVAHVHLKNPSIFEIYTYAPLARDVHDVLTREHAVAMTDGYGFSSLLDYEAGITPIFIGYTWQGREARRWVAPDAHYSRILFVDKEALRERDDMRIRLGEACARVVPGPNFAYPVAGLPPRRYYTTWCDELRPGAIGRLRWESDGAREI